MGSIAALFLSPHWLLLTSAPARIEAASVYSSYLVFLHCKGLTFCLDRILSGSGEKGLSWYPHCRTRFKQGSSVIPILPVYLSIETLEGSIFEFFAVEAQCTSEPAHYVDDVLLRPCTSPSALGTRLHCNFYFSPSYRLLIVELNLSCRLAFLKTREKQG